MWIVHVDKINDISFVPKFLHIKTFGNGSRFVKFSLHELQPSLSWNRSTTTENAYFFTGELYDCLIVSQFKPEPGSGFNSIYVYMVFSSIHILYVVWHDRGFVVFFFLFFFACAPHISMFSTFNIQTFFLFARKGDWHGIKLLCIKCCHLWILYDILQVNRQFYGAFNQQNIEMKNTYDNFSIFS